MAKALPFPKHKHPPVRATIAQALGSAASQTAAAVGEDQGTPGEVDASGDQDAGAPTPDGAAGGPKG